MNMRSMRSHGVLVERRRQQAEHESARHVICQNAKSPPGGTRGKQVTTMLRNAVQCLMEEEKALQEMLLQAKKGVQNGGVQPCSTRVSRVHVTA